MPILVNDSGGRFGLIPGRVPPARLTATAIVKAAFDLHPDAAAVLAPEERQPQLNGDLAWDDDPARGLRSPSDFAPFKPGTDLLLAGHCHTPGGRPLPYAQVSFGVGTLRKPAVVFGDRIHRGGIVGTGLSEPVPFTRMPLDWSRAYGGSGVAVNPVGRGTEERQLPDGSRGRPAPNIESVDRALSGGGGNPEPCGFGPLDPNGPARMRKVGTYGGAYLKEHWPGFPPDFDWSYFNAAPPDQYLPNIYLRGDEEFEFVNLDPDHPVFRGRLPGLQARCFVRVRKGNDLEFREIPLRIDTLLADLDARTVVLTWRGVTPAATSKLKEFEEFFVLLEPGRAPLGHSLADYEALYQRRREEQKKEIEVPPVILNPPVIPTITPASTAWADELEKVVAAIRAEAAVLWPPAPMPIGASGKPLPAAVIPPMPKIPATLEEAGRLMASDFAEAEAIHPGLLARYPLPDFKEAEEESAELEAYKGLPESEETPDDVVWTRDSVIRHVADGGHLEQQDLSELDLSGTVLDGVRLTGARLESTLLRDAGLRGANLDGCTLTGANLENARLVEASLIDADLSGITGDGADFERCSLAKADFSGSRLVGARFVGASAQDASFNECDLAGANFEAAGLRGAELTEALLTGAVFRNADLRHADLDGVEADRACFDGCRAFNLRASKANFAGATFRGSQLDESVFEESILTETDFRDAILCRATLTGSRLDRAVFGMVDMRNGKLDDVRAHDATFVGVNLFRGTFEDADFTGSNFLDCNFYEIEVFGANLEKVRIQDVLLKGSKLAR